MILAIFVRYRTHTPHMVEHGRGNELLAILFGCHNKHVGQQRRMVAMLIEVKSRSLSSSFNWERLEHAGQNLSILFLAGVLKISCFIFSTHAILCRMSNKTLTAKQIADRYNVAASTARAWCLNGTLPGAYLKETELGSFWVVPESELINFVPPKPGPKSKANSNNGRQPANGSLAALAAAVRAKKKGGKK